MVNKGQSELPICYGCIDTMAQAIGYETEDDEDDCEHDGEYSRFVN